MLKNFLSLMLIFSVISSVVSCSSEEPELSSKPKLLTFDIYDQTLETLLETVAERYELDLDFDVDEPETLYSLSIFNASIFDILKKLEADTGYYMKVVDDEILVDDEMIDENMTEVTLQLNENLWKDIHSVSKKIEIDEEVVQNFFGPLFTNVEVTDVDSFSKTVELYLPQEDVTFIKKSLLYLNFLKQRRNLAVSVFVVRKELSKSFLEGKAKIKDTEFAWKLNAGDNIAFTDDKGNKIDLNTQLLSKADDISTAEVFVKLKFNTESAENNFTFNNEPVQTAPLSEKLMLIVKPEWYTDGKKVSTEDLNSKVLSQYQKSADSKTDEVLKSAKGVKPGLNSVNELMTAFNSENFSVRIVSLTSGKPSDISAFKINCPSGKETLEEILSRLPQELSYFTDNNGILLDCQGSIRSRRNVQWIINREKIDNSYFKFSQGAFLVDKEGLNKPVVYLPSANALVGYANSNILK